MRLCLMMIIMSRLGQRRWSYRDEAKGRDPGRVPDTGPVPGTGQSCLVIDRCLVNRYAKYRVVGQWGGGPKPVGAHPPRVALCRHKLRVVHGQISGRA